MICPGDNLQTMGGPRGWFGVGGDHYTTGGKVGCQNRPIILSYGAHAAVKRVLLTKGKSPLAFFSIFCANLYVSRVWDIRHMGWVELLDKDGGEETWAKTVPAVWSVDTWNLWAAVMLIFYHQWMIVWAILCKIIIFLIFIMGTGTNDGRLTAELAQKGVFSPWHDYDQCSSLFWLPWLSLS